MANSFNLTSTYHQANQHQNFILKINRNTDHIPYAPILKVVFHPAQKPLKKAHNRSKA